MGGHRQLDGGALIQAEEGGVTQGNLPEMKKSDDLVIRRLLGLQHGYRQYLGLDDAWAARIIEAVGNYGEMFERDLGSGSPMKLARGSNNLCTQGGLIYALPIRERSPRRPFWQSPQTPRNANPSFLVMMSKAN